MELFLDVFSADDLNVNIKILKAIINVINTYNQKQASYADIYSIACEILQHAEEEIFDSNEYKELVEHLVSHLRCE